MNSNFKQNYTENSFFYNFGAKLILYIYRTLKVLDYSFRNHCSYHKESTYMYEFFFQHILSDILFCFCLFLGGGGVGGGGYYFLGQLQLTIIAHIMWAVGPLSVLFSLGTTHWVFFSNASIYRKFQVNLIISISKPCRANTRIIIRLKYTHPNASY